MKYLKHISNKDEKIFYNMMTQKGKRLIVQPYLREFKIRPDFYCIDDDTYYEVISTRQAYHSRKKRINHAIKMGIKIEVINPDGSKYYSKKPKIPRPINVKNYTITNIDDKFWRKLKRETEYRKVKIRDLILYFLKDFLGELKLENFDKGGK